MPGASFPKSEAEGWTPFRELTNEQRRRLEHRPGAVLRALNEPTELSPSDIEVLSKAKLVQAMDLLHADAQGRNMTYQELTVLSNIKNRLYCKTAGCGQIYCSHKD